MFPHGNEQLELSSVLSMGVYWRIVGILSNGYFKGTILLFCIAFSGLLFTRNVTLDAF